MKRFAWTKWAAWTAAAGLLAIAGCTTVASVKNPGTYVAAKQPRTVWLTKTDQSIVRMNGPRMVGDTVVGSVNGQYTEIPMADVSSMRAIVPDETKTIAVAAVGGAATVAALVVIFDHSGSGSGLPGPADTLTNPVVTDRGPYVP